MDTLQEWYCGMRDNVVGHSLLRHPQKGEVPQGVHSWGQNQNDKWIHLQMQDHGKKGERAKLANRIRASCVVCPYLNLHPMAQAMGGIPQAQFVAPVAWVSVDLDLFGPWNSVSKRKDRKGDKG